MQNKNVNDLIFSAQSHKGLQKGNTNTVDDVTATLDGSTHSEFKSFPKKHTENFPRKKTHHFTALIVIRKKTKSMCCGPTLVIKTD